MDTRTAAPAALLPAQRQAVHDELPDVPTRYVMIWFGCYIGLRLPKGAYLDHLALICSGPRHAHCLKGHLRGWWTKAVLWDVLFSIGLSWAGRFLALVYVYICVHALIAAVVGWL